MEPTRCPQNVTFRDVQYLGCDGGRSEFAHSFIHVPRAALAAMNEVSLCTPQSRRNIPSSEQDR